VAEPCCGGCSAPVSSCGCGSAVSYGSVMSSGCPNCSTTMDAGVIIEDAAPSAAPPAPTPEPSA
jgi:hypothetical protein